MDTSDVERGAQRVKGAATDMGGGLRSSLGGILAIAASAAALVGVSMGMRSIVQNTIQVNSMIEQATARYKALGDTSGAAQKRVADLMNFSRTTPFETQSIISAAEKLRILGGATLDTNQNLTRFGNAAAATGQQMETVSNMFGRLYQAIQNGQPVQRFALLMERLGILTPDVTKKLIEMQKAHASSAAMWDMVTGSLSRFNGAMDAQLGTWEGLNTAIHRSVADLEATAFKPLFATMEQGLIHLNQWLNSSSVQRAAIAFGQGLATVIQGITRFIANAWTFLSTDPATKPLRDFFGMVGGAVSNFFKQLAASGSLVKALGSALDSLGDPGRHAHDVISAVADVLAPRLRLALQSVVPLMWSAVAAFTAFELARGTISMLQGLEQAFVKFRAAATAGGIGAGLASVLGLTELGPVGIAIIAITALGAALAGLYLLVKPVHEAINQFFSAVALGVRTAWPTFLKTMGQVGDTLRATFITVSQIIAIFLSLFTGINSGTQSITAMSTHFAIAHSVLAALFAYLFVFLPQVILMFVEWGKVGVDSMMLVAVAAANTAKIVWDVSHGRLAQALADVIVAHREVGNAADQTGRDISTAWAQTMNFFNGRVVGQMDSFASQIDNIFLGIGSAANGGTRTAQTALANMQEDTRRKSIVIQKNAEDIAQAIPRAMAAAKAATIKSVLDTMEGFLRGLESYVAPVQTTAAKIANSVPAEVTTRGKAHSPSQVMFALGQDYGEGYRLGLAGTLGGLITTARQGVSGVIGAFGVQPGTLAAALRVGTLPGTAAVAAGGGAAGGQAPVEQYNFNNHFYEADLQATDVSSEMAWLMKTRRKGR